MILKNAAVRPASAIFFSVDNPTAMPEHVQRLYGCQTSPSTSSPPSPVAFLAHSGVTYRLVDLKEKESFFHQGAFASDVFYLLTGRAKLTVVSNSGKEITVAMISAKQFFGAEACAAERGSRLANATAVVHSTAVKIDRKEVLRLLRHESSFFQLFIASLLAQSVRSQADNVDLLSNSSRRRLARILLLMAETAKPGHAVALIPEVTQETLADMIGTTRSRTSKFMNEFRKLGFIDYRGRIRVNTKSLSAMLDE